MAIFSEEERQRISAALNSRGINRPCPACGQWDISLVDGYVTHRVYSSADLDADTADAGAVPCIALTCTHCGYLSHHTVGGLGLSSPQA
jgi:uncharacterized protein (DUF983 family)